MIPEGKIVSVESVEREGDFVLTIRFSDDTAKTVDFEPFLSRSKNPHIRKYLDAQLFGAYSVTDGDLEWNDYDLCFPIADLYEGTLIRQTV